MKFQALVFRTFLTLVGMSLENMVSMQEELELSRVPMVAWQFAFHGFVL